MTQHDTQRRFGGLARLYGEHGLSRFQQAHICVIGIGGVGSWVVEALARSAVGAITMIDLDNIAESNVNRQLHALDHQFGKAKTTAMAERIRLINPDCKITEIEDFVEPDNLHALFGEKQYDWIVDGIDNYRTKAALAYYCRRNKIQLITIGGAGGQIDPTRIKIADLSQTERDPLLAKMRKLLRQEYQFSKNLKRRFYIPAVYSDEQLLYPAADGGTSHQRPSNASATGLSCAGGLGSAVAVTASFGFAASAHLLQKIASAEHWQPVVESQKPQGHLS